MFAEVPPYMRNFGDYPIRDRQGRKNYLRITGNMPGRRDAGAIWGRRYDDFLKSLGMVQSVVDVSCLPSTLNTASCSRTYTLTTPG